MNKHLVDFQQIQWQTPAVGVRFKEFINGNRKIRLLEFTEGFLEKEYCIHAHVIYVLDGPFTLDFNGTMEIFKTGDTVIIPYGEEDKHKATINSGEKVLLLLIEQVDNY
jgi:hypothetical protein